MESVINGWYIFCVCVLAGKIVYIGPLMGP